MMDLKSQLSKCLFENKNLLDVGMSFSISFLFQLSNLTLCVDWIFPPFHSLRRRDRIEFYFYTICLFNFTQVSYL